MCGIRDLNIAMASLIDKCESYYASSFLAGERIYNEAFESYLDLRFNHTSSLVPDMNCTTPSSTTRIE